MKRSTFIATVVSTGLLGLFMNMDSALSGPIKLEPLAIRKLDGRWEVLWWDDCLWIRTTRREICERWIDWIEPEENDMLTQCYITLHPHPKTLALAGNTSPRNMGGAWKEL